MHAITSHLSHIDLFGPLRGLIFDPVCGSDGRTYSNIAWLRMSECFTGNRKVVLSQKDCVVSKVTFQ